MTPLLKTLCLGDADAERFCVDILRVVGTYDDLIDRDEPVSDADLHQMMWAVLVTLPRNPFYRKWFEVLNPTIMQAITNWKIANQFEHARTQHEVAFIIRSSYVDVFCMVALLVGGERHAVDVGMQLRAAVHSETFAAYMEEMEATYV